MARQTTVRISPPLPVEVERAMRRANSLLESYLARIARLSRGPALTRPLRATINEILRCELRDRSIRSGLLLQTLQLADGVSRTAVPRRRAG